MKMNFTKLKTDYTPSNGKVPVGDASRARSYVPSNGKTPVGNGA
jgi:hypothetical protein